MKLKLHPELLFFYVVFTLLASIILYLLIFAPRVHSDEAHPQLVFTFERREPDGKAVVYIKKATIVMALTPIGKTQALAHGDYMICTPLMVVVGVRKLNGEDIGPRGEIAFKCGKYLYVMTTLNIRPEK